VRQIVHATAVDAGETPPTEFRIFKAGLNTYTKGEFNFTAASAARIMADYRQCGVDMMIDLEHESIIGEPVRPDSRDARGWYGLEMRGAELWAVNVRWTPDGARRLAEKTQRYISATFGVNRETNEIVDLVNCALVGMPATHEAPALVAASRRTASESECVTMGAALARRLRANATRVTLGGKST
jgi:phage I-like protein